MAFVIRDENRLLQEAWRLEVGGGAVYALHGLTEVMQTLHMCAATSVRLCNRPDSSLLAVAVRVATGERKNFEAWLLDGGATLVTEVA